MKSTASFENFFIFQQVAAFPTASQVFSSTEVVPDFKSIQSSLKALETHLFGEVSFQIDFHIKLRAGNWEGGENGHPVPKFSHWRAVDVESLIDSVQPSK